MASLGYVFVHLPERSQPAHPLIQVKKTGSFGENGGRTDPCEVGEGVTSIHHLIIINFSPAIRQARSLTLRPAEKPEVANLPLFRAMNEEERDRIFSGSFLQVFPPQLVLFEVGQRADFLHVLVDGLAELYTSVGDRDTTMRIVQPVRSFILAAVVTDLPYLMSARTLESSRVLLVPAALMREVVRKDTALMEATMRELAFGYRDLVLALADMKLRQSAERLAHFILQQHDVQGLPETTVLPAEKRVLASLLGMTPENLSRAFGLLGKQGVSLKGRMVRMSDRAKLETLARPDKVPR